jgi:hypothetical protein
MSAKLPIEWDGSNQGVEEAIVDAAFFALKGGARPYRVTMSDNALYSLAMSIMRIEKRKVLWENDQVVVALKDPPIQHDLTATGMTLWTPEGFLRCEAIGDTYQRATLYDEAGAIVGNIKLQM